MKKQTKKLSIKVRDLKPVKDAKGGRRKRRRHLEVNTANATGDRIVTRTPTGSGLADFKEP